MYVYFVRCRVEVFIENFGRRLEYTDGGKYKYFYKIGMAANVGRRMSQLQTGCPLPLELVGSLKCSSRQHAASIERQLHDLFDMKRRVGEWFDFRVPHRYAAKQIILSWPRCDLATQIPVWKQEARFLRDKALKDGTIAAWPKYVDAPIDILNRKAETDRVELSSN